MIAVLGAQALARYGRSFPAAVAVAADAVELAEANGGVEQASLAGGCSPRRRRRRRPRLCNGPSRSCGTCPSGAPGEGPAGLAYLAHHAGRYEEAVARDELIVEILPIGQGFLRCKIERIERAPPRSAGRGRRLIALLEDAVAPEMMSLTGIGRAKGTLAVDDEEATTDFANAVLVGRDRKRLRRRAGRDGRARLRRSRRGAESRRYLERAVEPLRAVGATLPRSGQCQRRGVGGVVEDEDVMTFQLLTAS